MDGEDYDEVSKKYPHHNQSSELRGKSYRR